MQLFCEHCGRFNNSKDLDFNGGKLHTKVFTVNGQNGKQTLVFPETEDAIFQYRCEYCGLRSTGDMKVSDVILK